MPPSVSHKRQSGARLECAGPALRRCEHPLRIGVHINRDAEPREWPTLLVADRLGAHIEEYVVRFLVGQTAVLVKMVDDLGIRALDVLRIDLEMFDQGLFRTLLILLRHAYSKRVAAE